MQIVVFPLGPLETNCYLIHDGKEAVFIDAGGDPASVVEYLKKNNLKLTHILCTHLHFDHTYGVKALQDATGATVYAGDKDAFLLNEEGGRGAWGMPKVENYGFTNLEPGSMSLCGTACEVLATPGHTPGSLSFYFPELEAVFVGDALFYRSIGRTDFAGGSFEELARSIRGALFALPPSTVAYPGHGPHTVIGDEMRGNPYVGTGR